MVADGARNCGVRAGDCAGGDGDGAGSEHDDGAGDGVSGERSAGRRDTGDQLAVVHDRSGPGGGCGHDDGDHWAGRICERKPRAECGRDACGRVLHGRVLHERRDNEHAVLGGSGRGAGQPGASAGEGDAGGAGGAGGEQSVCGPGDCAGEPEQRADSNRRNADRTTVFEQRSDATTASRGQALRGYAGGHSGATGGRKHDGRADHARDERSAGSGGSECTDNAASSDECRGSKWGDGDSADVRGERYIHERERRESDGSAHDGRATGGAQREGVWRGMRRRDRRYERPAGGAELRERARRGADDSARDVQDADT